MKPGLGTAAIVLSMCALIAPPVAPAAGARSAPIGSIVQATHDKGAVDTSLEGTTIFDGDNLTTGSTNTLMARLSGPQMYLGSNSGVVLRGIANGFSATLTSGMMAASAGKGQTFQLVADGLTVEPLNAVPTVARMTLLSATALELTAEKGTLKVSMGDETDTVEEGKSYRFEIETEPALAEPQGPPIAAGRNRFKKVLIIILAATTAIIVWRATVSPSAPQ